MPAGDVRAEFDAMLRRKAEQAVAAHDPSESGRPATHLDPKVSKVVYELRDAGITTQVGAIHAIADREGAGLNPGQIAKLLWQFPAPPEDDPPPPPAPAPQLRPVGPAYIPRELVGPDHELHDQGRHDDPPGVSWAEH